jgi:hypothetical protein
MIARRVRERWFALYALALGILGILALAYLFAHQTTTVDLFTLLLFTVTAVIVSSFQVPIYRSAAQSLLRRSPTLAALGDVELGMEGAVLLGIMLTAGPSLGGWVAFISGLVTSVLSRPRAHSAPCAGQAMPAEGLSPGRANGGLSSALGTAAQSTAAHGPTVPGGSRCKSHSDRLPSPWVEHAASALLNGGRGVLAIAAAWWAYHGMGGALRPFTMSTNLALALIVMCIVYALVRRSVAWLALVLLHVPPWQGVEVFLGPGALAIELLPLPVAFLVSATYGGLGWSCFLMLAMVFIGMGAAVWQMMETIWNGREQVYLLKLRQEVSQAAADAAHDVDALCALAYRFCDEAVAPAKFEIGLYDCTQTLVYIRMAVENGSSLPPMSIPQTPLWTWLSELKEGALAETGAEITALPFALPPLESGHLARAAIFAPLFPARQQDLPMPAESADPSASVSRTDDAMPQSLGAIVVQSSIPNGFNACALARVQVVAEQIGSAIGKVQSAPAA